MKKIIICTVCPNGCEVEAEYTPTEGLKLSGYRCRRGIEYCTNECFDPKRTFTSSVAITGATRRRLPVRTTAPIPKELLLRCADEVHSISVEAPIACGDVIVKNLFDTGVDLVACMTLEKKER